MQSLSRRLRQPAAGLVAVVALVVGAVITGCGAKHAAAPPTMPNVVGSSMGEARGELDRAGITYRVEGHDDARSVVTSQFPGPGEPATDPSRVRITASTVFETAASECANFAEGFLGDDGGSMTLDMAGQAEAGAGKTSLEQVECITQALEIPDSVWSKMLATRAIDGQLSDSWGVVKATWSYHPDSGLDVVLELAD